MATEGSGPVSTSGLPAAAGSVGVVGETAGAPAAAQPGAPAGSQTATAPGTAAGSGVTPGTAGPSASGPKGAAGSAGAVAADAPCTSQGAPLVIGQNGVWSGLLGANFIGAKTAMSIWAKHVNAKGGLACHPVQLYQTDDGSDPARGSANVTDLILSKKVQALVGLYAPINMAAQASVFHKYNIPVVGGDITDFSWSTDPLLFAQGTSPLHAYASSLKEARLATGYTKFGILSCVEATTCTKIRNSMTTKGGMADLAGVEVAYNQTISLTQTDFTAECQNAKKAGAQVMYLVMDAASLQRLFRSCDAIGYKFPWSGPSLTLTPDLQNDPILRGSTDYVGYFGSSSAPWMSNDTAATKEFQEAYKTYAPGTPPSPASMTGWASGKMLEAVVANIPNARNGPITTAQIFKGLYALKNETLGGLVPGMTFNEGKPSPIVSCYYAELFSRGVFSDPFGSKKRCL
ncbi:ABC transporter substrate-binding protein [Sporichthya sp.]|uniref:ABC transporter substrate-binding protein n=1 Tax=Sporichthya sp. TaxID=65475 RepID=UPI00180F1533|nr:ABC transporter substrate-binding protein [Sporichthya sp.]MBA3743282.1 ABC transporter substrate-binding protein [Sporichthya sp.]